MLFSTTYAEETTAALKLFESIFSLGISLFLLACDENRFYLTLGLGDPGTESPKDNRKLFCPFPDWRRLLRLFRDFLENYYYYYNYSSKILDEVL